MPDQTPPRPDIAVMPPMDCPYCGKPLGAMLTHDQRPIKPPTSGTFMVCVPCRQPAVYVTGPLGSSLRQATPEELAEFAVDFPDMIHRLAQLNLPPNAKDPQ